MNWKEVEKELANYEVKNERDMEAIVAINKNCQPFLKNIRYGQKLFRGADKKTPPTIVEITPRRDREPKDTVKAVHDKLNAAFKKKFGVRARSEAVFCAPNHDFAAQYGSAYYVFPIGSFKVLWSPKIMDLYIELRNKDIMVWKDGPGSDLIMNPYVSEDEIDTAINHDIVGQYKMDTNNAEKALYSGHEIMLFCRKYYLANTYFVMNHFSAIFAQSKEAPRL